MSDKPDTPVASEVVREHPEGEFIPGWLALLVLVLLLAVMAVGGYALRGCVAGEGHQPGIDEAEIRKWEKAVDKDSSNVDARVQLGYAYQQAGRLDDALEQYTKVLDGDPKNTAALFNRAAVWQRLELDDKAEEGYWEVLEVEPEHALAAKALGDIYIDREEYFSAIKAVRPAAEANPQIADLQYQMGLAYERTGRIDWAISRYRMALEVAPNMEEARTALKRLGETP